MVRNKPFEFNGLKAQLISALGKTPMVRNKPFEFNGLKAQLISALGNA